MSQCEKCGDTIWVMCHNCDYGVRPAEPKCERCGGKGMIQIHPEADIPCPDCPPTSIEDRVKALAKEFLRQRTIARYGTANVLSGGGDQHIDIRDMAKFAIKYAQAEIDRQIERLQYAMKQLEYYIEQCPRRDCDCNQCEAYKIVQKALEEKQDSQGEKRE